MIHFELKYGCYAYLLNYCSNIKYEPTFDILTGCTCRREIVGDWRWSNETTRLQKSVTQLRNTHLSEALVKNLSLELTNSKNILRNSTILPICLDGSVTATEAICSSVFGLCHLHSGIHSQIADGFSDIHTQDSIHNYNIKFSWGSLIAFVP